MIFGRKKQAESTDPVEEVEVVDDAVDAGDHTDAGDDVEADDVADDDAGEDDADSDEPDSDEADSDAADEDDDAQWQRLDESKDWRDDGPFDASEVDLSGDAAAGIERVDLGSLIVTPEEEVAVQLQLQQETGKVQAIVAMHANSGLEVALFAAPAKTSMLPEVRAGLIEASAEVGGSVDLAEGPFGTEIRRLLPLQGPDGQTFLHPSRIWLVQGPRWLLRGVLMGEAGMQEALEGSAGVLVEFFRNIVVSRDTTARVPGDLVLLNLPEGVTVEEGPGPDADAAPAQG